MRGDYLNNSPRFSPLDLHHLGREESGWSILRLCGRGWSRAPSGWMTACQAKGRESEEQQEPCFRIQSSDPRTRTMSVGWKTSNTSFRWTSIGGTFYLPNTVMLLGLQRRARLGSVGIRRGLTLEKQCWRLLIFPWGKERFSDDTRTEFPEIE